jgi:class 3 adenylate cyclase
VARGFLLPCDVMVDVVAADGPHTIEAFLHSAQQRGERAVALARMVTCAAFLAMHLPFRLTLLAHGDAKSWLIVGGLLVGLGYSVLALRWSRAGTVTPARLHLSVVIDAAVVYTTLGAGVAWPHANYAGVIREHELVIVHLAVIAAGIRLSERGALLGAGLHAVGLAGLLVADRVNAARITYSSAEMVFAAAFLCGAAIIGHSVAYRTRKLVVQGAASAVVAERARQRLGVYVSEEVASTAMADSGSLQLGGSNKQAAVLFSDLRGFTRYSEDLAPSRIVEELNDYLHDMVAEIRAEGGVVDKYIGDAIMAVFGVPKERPDDALRALRAVVRMRAALVRHNARRAERGLGPLAHGVGVHFGAMVAGNIGTAERMQYTVIGDAVNLASRLETATKEQRVDALISGEAVRAAQTVGLRLPPVRPLGTIEVRGHERPVEVFTLDQPG